MTPLIILFDTNLFYACEDINENRQHQDATLATRLKELAIRHGASLKLHPATAEDIRRTNRTSLRDVSLLKMRQWDILELPHVRASLASEAGYIGALSPNDKVDLGMLAAIDSNAVDILVTQDRGLRNHAERLNRSNQVMSLRGAIEYLETLAGVQVHYPSVSEVAAYTIDIGDPIFDSLRHDYAGFDAWFSKVRRDHRRCLTIGPDGGELEAIAILKDETDRPYGLAGRVLKVCTFKVADHAAGAKRGELLLKAIFRHAASGGHDRIYVEVFDHHESIVRLLEAFGFDDCGQQTARGEMVMVKKLRPMSADMSLHPLEFHRRFGPGQILVRNAFIVPIQPRWHQMLFPELSAQLSLMAPDAHGNAIKKAYLSNANTTRVAEGDVLLFYRSEDMQAVTAIGVVDGTTRSRDPAVIRRYVGQRTVYSDNAIAQLCEESGPNGLLAVLFRQDRVLLPQPWSYEQLKDNGALRGPPQSIQQITDQGAITWITSQLA